MARDKKGIKKDILDMFRSLENEDRDILPPELLESDYFKHLNWDEKQLYQNAVKELISNGIVENIKGSALNLKLTDKGVDLLFLN